MKWKLKYFIRGLGVGIIFTAIVMSISLQASRSRIIRENALTKQEIMEKAYSYGMVLGKEEDSASTLTDEDTQKKQEEDTKKQEEVSNKQEDSEGQEVASTEDNSKEDQDVESTKKDDKIVKEEKDNIDTNEQNAMIKEDKNSDNEDKSDNNSIVSIDYVPITVTSGMTATSVSKYLKEVGIIEDSDEFRAYLSEQGYAAKIRTGEYLIPVSSTYKKIADIITRKN